MLGQSDALSVGPEDDDLHEPTSPHPWWTETSWLQFSVPERNLSVNVYPWFRPNLGLLCGGVMVWDDTTTLPWQIPYCRYDWHLVLPDRPNLRSARLPTGLVIECEQPNHQYRLRYDDPACAFDVRFTSTMPPHLDGSDGRVGHVDQPGRVVGSLRHRLWRRGDG